MKATDILYNKVERAIRAEQLIQKDDSILVALSGGADSVALLMVLTHLGYRCEAAHCNFRLRGEESDRDEAFVRDLCAHRGVRLHVTSFNTKDYAREHGVSIEMAARDLRYAYFERLRREEGFDKIAVAHHRNDNVETLLLNLIRGTGLKGLTGMRPRNGYVIRPMLEVGRDEIEDFLTEAGQAYVTDSSNLEADVTRNKIRLNLLPEMKGINPAVSDSLHDTIRRLDDAYMLYTLGVERCKEQILCDGRINISRLQSVPAPRTVLFEILNGYGFNSAQVDEIYEQMHGTSGKVYESREWRLLRDRGSFELLRKGEAYQCLCHVLPLEGYVQVAPDCAFIIRRAHYDEHFTIPRTADTVCLDVDKLEYPITIRLAEEGDRFVPFGMDGAKLVSDYLTDRKKTLFEKERQLVVCSGERIAWLVNERADNRFRVDEHTLHVLLIQAVRG